MPAGNAWLEEALGGARWVAVLRRLWGGLLAVVGPSRPSALFRRADHLRNEGRYEEAARLVADGLRQDPASSVGHLLSAYLHVANRAMDRAKVEFDHVLALDPYHPRALLGLARISLEEQDIAGATNLLDRALQYYADFPEAQALREMVRSWSETSTPAGEVSHADSAVLAAEEDVVVMRLDGTVVVSRAPEERAQLVAQHQIQTHRMASATLARAGFGILRRSVVDTETHLTFVHGDADCLLSATLNGDVEIPAGLAQTGRLWTELGIKV